MHLVVDAVAVRPGSAAIVTEHLLRGWTTLAADDRLTVLCGPDGPAFAVPPGVDTLQLGRPGPIGGLWSRSFGIRRATTALHADAVLSAVPASSLAGTRAPRGIILYDLRHELRPQQFSRSQRIARRLAWGWSMAHADGIYTISERTLADLRHRHPRVAGRGRAAVLGADHVDAWPVVAPVEPPYALAFGHFANKNADAVIEGWARACRDGAVDADWTLRLVGMGASDRATASGRITALGIDDRVQVMPWLDDAEFASCFAASSLVLFPSDFEGFGLPAVEALRLGIPVVVSDDAALAEVTGGHAIVTRSTAPGDLVGAISEAIALTPPQRAAGRRFTDSLTWRRTASTIRESLLAAGQDTGGAIR